MVEPGIWGPALWKAIHYVALGYPAEPTDEQKRKYLDFFVGFGDVIPCGKCRENYKRHLLEVPLDLQSRETLFAWTVAVHNIVNRENSKPELSTDAAMDMYVSPRDYIRRANQSNRDAWISVCVGMACIMIVAPLPDACCIA